MPGGADRQPAPYAGRADRRLAPYAGRVAFVTGAGSGMGAATAELLAARGARVALVGRRPEALAAVSERITASGGHALILPTDVSDRTAVAKAVQQTVAAFGALHWAVNNAGVGGNSHLLATTHDDEWLSTIQINLFGVFYGMREQIPAMLASGGGAIVNVSSVFSERGLPARAAYAASKHALRGLSRTAAREYAPQGIRINELLPGVIRTPMTDADRAGSESLVPTIPLGRMGNGREVAEAIAFLLSDSAAYIVGARLAVDGGWLT